MFIYLIKRKRELYDISLTGPNHIYEGFTLITKSFSKGPSSCNSHMGSLWMGHKRLVHSNLYVLGMHYFKIKKNLLPTWCWGLYLVVLPLNCILSLEKKNLTWAVCSVCQWWIFNLSAISQDGLSYLERIVH